MGITLWQYYLNRAAELANNVFAGINTLDDWERVREQVRKDFFKSIGLWPVPEKCDLKITETGEFSGKGYRAKKLAYQIFPDCFSSANFYLPSPLPDGTDKLPAVLFVCGHHSSGIWGYQDHAALWARRGYACLIFDTLEQTDNAGTHKGLIGGFRNDWLSMGYSAVGGEVLNSMRALDVLCSMPHVDVERIGATGISGGGANSFYVTVADERIKALATVAGVATPEYTLASRHLPHHCDCMYFHNPYGYETSEFAGVIAPRPVLFCYASEDSLFSNDEYKTLVERTRKIYELYGSADKCRLFEYPGPHAYRNETIDVINDWFDKYVSGREHAKLQRTDYEHRPGAVSVFGGKLPEPDRVDILPELITPVANIKLPEDEAEWLAIRKSVIDRLKDEVFYNIEQSKPKFDIVQRGDWLANKDGLRYLKFSGSVDDVDVWVEVWQPADACDIVLIAVADEQLDAERLRAETWDNASGMNLTFVYIEPRGSGFTAVRDNERTMLLRAGALTGKTPVMLIMEDLKVITEFLRTLDVLKGKEFYICGWRDSAVACLYYSLFDEEIRGAILTELPISHKAGGYVPGILRVTDIEHAIGLLAPRGVGLINTPQARSSWSSRVYERLNCADRHIMSSSFCNVVRRLMSDCKPKSKK